MSSPINSLIIFDHTTNFDLVISRTLMYLNKLWPDAQVIDEDPDITDGTWPDYAAVAEILAGEARPKYMTVARDQHCAGATYDKVVMGDIEPQPGLLVLRFEKLDHSIQLTAIIHPQDRPITEYLWRVPDWSRLELRAFSVLLRELVKPL